MWSCVRNLNTYTIELDARMSAIEQQSIRRGLLSRRGVLAARFAPDVRHRLVIDYDADLVGPLGLLDCARGIEAEPGARAGTGTRASAVPDGVVTGAATS